MRAQKTRNGDGGGGGGGWRERAVKDNLYNRIRCSAHPVYCDFGGNLARDKLAREGRVWLSCSREVMYENCRFGVEGVLYWGDTEEVVGFRLPFYESYLPTTIFPLNLERLGERGAPYLHIIVVLYSGHASIKNLSVSPFRPWISKYT